MCVHAAPAIARELNMRVHVRVDTLNVQHAVSDHRACTCCLLTASTCTVPWFWPVAGSTCYSLPLRPKSDRTALRCGPPSSQQNKPSKTSEDEVSAYEADVKTEGFSGQALVGGA